MDELHSGIAPDPNPERWFAKLSSTIESREKEWEGFNSNKVWEERFRKRESSLLVKKKTLFKSWKCDFWKIEIIQEWEEKFLSQAGREILIKVVVQAILTYTMSCFKLSEGLCTEIESPIWKFW